MKTTTTMRHGLWLIGAIVLGACGDTPNKTPETQNEIPGYPPEELPPSIVVGWKVLQDGHKKLAIEWDEGDGEEEKALPEADREGAPEWLHGRGFEVEVVLTGPGAGENMKLWAEDDRLATEGGIGGACSVKPIGLEAYQWSCHFAAEALGTEETGFKLKMQPGPNPELPSVEPRIRERLYKMDITPPWPLQLPGIEVRGRGTPGESFSVCPDTFMDSGSGVKYAEITQVRMAIPAHFPPENVKKNGPCIDVHVPLDVFFELYEPPVFQFNVGLAGEDKVGNIHEMGVFGIATLNRVGCSGARLLEEEAVWQPPVLVGEKIAFGTSVPTGGPAYNSVYFVDKNCRPVSSHPTGAVQGPMVALGGSGKLALAVEGGTPLLCPPKDYRPGEETASRLLLLGPAGRIYERSMDCIHNAVDAHYSASFDKGLSLVSWPLGWPDGKALEWVLSAPLNASEGGLSQIIAYSPNVENVLARCISHYPYGFPSPLSVAPVWTGKGGADGSGIGATAYIGGDTGLISFFSFDGGRFYPVGTEASIASPFPAPMKPKALSWGGSEQLWAHFGGGIATNFGSLLWYDSLEQLGRGIGYAWTPAAVDSLGRAYAIETWTLNAGSQTLHRFDANDRVGSSWAFPGVGTVGYVVGSPLLGEARPGSEAEVYMVTNLGMVLAYNAETLTELWRFNAFPEANPPTRIASDAQPLLEGNTLWLVGTRGEVAGVRVNSDGLSRSALWPKHLHDNCNTGNQGVNTYNLIECLK